MASRLRKICGCLRPLPSSKAIPTPIRVRIFRALVEPIARWWLELIVWTKLSNSLKEAYGSRVKALVGANSRDTIPSVYCLSLEPVVPLLEELRVEAKARAFYWSVARAMWNVSYTKVYHEGTESTRLRFQIHSRLGS